MANALWITVIGMGLVFFAILLLWGLMALLVRLTAGSDPAAAPAAPPVEPEIQDEAALSSIRARAAAAAVAAALALGQQRADRARPEQRDQGTVSAWQAVHRAADLKSPSHSSRNR